ncbi:MAG: aminoglycoside phosphotransferase family protein [Actinomycetota bacterium]|nr:aminoglycoside phosphotransferase family protein [Actinomycetota bacterium]
MSGGPARRIGGERDRVLFVLTSRTPGGAPSDGDRWLPVADLDALDEPVEVVSVHEQLARIGREPAGPAQVLKSWSQSTVLRYPWRGAGGADTAYLKATCGWFRHEPAITQVLGRIVPEHVPTVLAVDARRGWMLMGPLPGHDRPEAEAESESEDAVVATARVLAQVQLRSVDRLAELAAAGCPDRTLEPTLAALSHLLKDGFELPQLTGAERARVRATHPWLAEQVRTLYGCGLPVTVAHGDLHPGNVAVRGEQLVIYDWTDACLSHPVLDAAGLAHWAGANGAATAEQVWSAYLQVCRSTWPEADLDTARSVAPVVNKVFQMVSYEGIYRAQEPVSRWELAGVQVGILRSLLEQETAPTT